MYQPNKMNASVFPSVRESTLSGFTHHCSATYPADVRIVTAQPVAGIAPELHIHRNVAEDLL